MRTHTPRRCLTTKLPGTARNLAGSRSLGTGTCEQGIFRVNPLPLLFVLDYSALNAQFQKGKFNDHS